MTKKTTSNNENQNEEIQNFDSEDYTRERPKRRKTYEKLKDSDIPKELKDYFFKKGYALRFIRWSTQGEPDYRYLHRRQNEDGYEFVTKDELPAGMLKSMRVLDTQVTKGMITNGSDVCLMKVDLDFQKSRQDYYDKVADNEIESVDVNVYQKKGLRNAGSKSQTMFREPTFQD